MRNRLRVDRSNPNSDESSVDNALDGSSRQREHVPGDPHLGRPDGYHRGGPAARHATSITLSRISNDQAKVESVLGSAADRVANFAYSPCPGADGTEYLDIARAAAPAVGWTGAVVTIDEVSFWHPATPTDRTVESTNSLSPTECLPSVSMTDQRTLQKVRIRVTSPGGDYSRTIDVVKANFRPDEIRDQT